MKLVHRNITKDSSGQVTLIPEDGEDMWHAYNIIQAGDSLRSTTVRKVQVESNTGSVGSSRVRTTLTITVEALDFDFQACVLRVKGRNIVENQFVKMGAYHTLDLEVNRKFTLAKKCWDSVVLDRIDAACDPTQNSDVAAIVMQEGIAHVCLVLASMTLVRAKIEMQIPRKKRGSSQQHDKGVEKFFDSVLQAILRHVNFDVVKCVLVASPGFVKDQFFEYMFNYAVKTDNRVLIENKSKFLLIHASSGFKHSLKEVLSDPSVIARLADTKAAAEIRAMESFYKMLQQEPDRAYYGEKEVEKASKVQAIDTLLICDSLLRTHDVAKRRRLIEIVDSVRENGGTVRMFSSMHITGEQLAQLTGIAAMLRFPVPDLTDDESSSEEDE
ncbi:protein pelota homolog [Styela clava]|uniref:protein pelota homolog n=1 Tax=Styela clava TaxID=7725 RepID=UPI00193A1C6E|nr:protein pelota homolog [Styela clava]